MRLAQQLDAHVAALSTTIAASVGTIEGMIDGLCSCFSLGGKLMLCGNGGSAADAQHIAGEFVNRLLFDRRPLPALALTTDTSVLTCIANDARYDDVFSRQVEALAKPGDILAGLSTSGGSTNVRAALSVARDMGLCTFGFTGSEGGALLSPLCDFMVPVAATYCAGIQEVHEFIWHFIATAVEERLFGRPEHPGTGEHE